MTEQVKAKIKRNYTIWWIVGGCCLILVIMTLIGLGLFYFIYKVAEPNAPVAITSSTPVAKSARIYSNDKYNFFFTIPESWGEYEVEENTDELGGVNFSVYIKTKDQSFDSEKPGWAKPVIFTVYEQAKWDVIQSDLFTTATEHKITEKNDYVYVYSHWQDCAEDLCSKVDIQDIVKTFQVE